MSTTISPTISPAISPQKARFVELLEELFRLNQPELDFGRYRIVHARNKEIRAFMQTELATEIDAAFAGQASQTAHSTLQAARRKVLDNLDDDAFDATGDLKPEHHATKLGKDFLNAQQQARKDGGPLANDAQVYDHLYRFFRAIATRATSCRSATLWPKTTRRRGPMPCPMAGRGADAPGQQRPVLRQEQRSLQPLQL